MTLALDASYSLGSELSGVGVYSRELLHGLAAEYPEQRFLWKYRPHRFRQALREQAPSNVRRGILWNRLGVRRGLFHGLNQRLPSRRYPLQVVTFHDLFVLTDEYSTPEFRKRFVGQARHAAEEADRIVAVSQFTADQVYTELQIPRDRIRVVHHGVTPRKLPDVARENMVLSVGAIQTRKNTGRLIEAFLGMPSDWRLVLAGSAGFGAEQILRHAQHSRIAVTGYLPEAELSELYARASIFAFPSLAEGFGMPILEAMAAGIPVITSNCSAMPEVAGNAAILIDPMDVDGLKSALCALARNSQMRSQFAALGRKRAKLSSWERASRETFAVYEDLISCA